MPTPYLNSSGLFAPSYLARVISDPRGACPRSVPDDIDTRLAALAEIWGRYRPSLVEAAPKQGGLFTDLAETRHVGLPPLVRPLPKTQEAVAEGFVSLVLEQVCGYHAEPKPPLNDSATGKKIIPDYVCFASQDAAVRLRSNKNMPDARTYCADALLIVDAKRFGKGVGADEAGDEQTSARGSKAAPKAAAKESTASEDVEQVLGYLRSTGKRWGVLTNGRSWRLMETGEVEAHLRFDLVLFAEDLLARNGVFTDADRDTLTLFLHLFGPSATSGGYLDLLARESEVEIRRVRDILRRQAHEAVSIVANGFLLHEGNAFVTRDGDILRSPPQHILDEVRELSLVFLYRLLFALKAEAMNLLPMKAPNGAKTAYAKFASTEAIFHAVSALSVHERTLSGEAFKMLRNLFQLIDKGGEYGVIAYNGGLFAAHEHADLERLRLHDDAIHALLASLIYLDADASNTNPSAVVTVPYADLDVRDLGDVYEGLLELRLVRVEEIPLDAQGARPFVLRNQDGEKKASGSYFTPDTIVAHLVRRSLEPLLDACGKDAEAILSLKVIDPAMGSGHFLVKAIDIIAWHLTLHCRPLDQGVTNDNGPQELAYWKRRVVERCIYGVDVNPMAVELAKVALWLHTASAGKPLSFLDHHLKCGNALVGARLQRLNLPALVARKTKKGDVWEARSTGEETPKPKRKAAASPEPEQRPLTLDVDGWWMQDILKRVANVMAQPANTAADVQAKMLSHRDVDQRLRCHRLLADLWCAQWFLVKPDADAVDVYENAVGLFEQLRTACLATGPEGEALRRNETERVADEPLVKTIQRARDEGYGPRLYKFFHWELEFPEVAFDAQGKRRDGFGFDAVVGNPPWNKLKPAKRDFYGPFSDEVANTQGPSLDKLIDRLQRERVELLPGWETYSTQMETLVEYLGAGGDYTFQSVVLNGKKTGGDPDLFRFFIERAHQLAREGGRIGQVVPSTLWQSEGCTGLRQLLLERYTLESLYTFENYRKWAFAIDSRFKFNLFVGSRNVPVSGHTFPAAFMLRDARLLEGGQPERVVTLSRAFIDAVSPGTLALLDVKHDLESKLVERLHAEHPALGTEKSGWGVKYRNELHMTNDAWMFRSREWMKARGFTQVMPVRDAQGAWTQRSDGPGEVAGVPADLPLGGEYWVAASEIYYRKRAFVERSGEVNGKPARWFLHKTDVGKEENKARIFAGERYTALYEGRMVHNVDHAQKGYVSGEGRRALWQELSIEEKKLTPRVFVVSAEAGDRLISRTAFCDVTGATNERTMLSALVPASSICGNKVPTLDTKSTTDASLLVALLASFTWDALIRLRVSTTLNWIYVRAIPTPKPNPDAAETRALLTSIARLSCTTPEMADVWTHVFPDVPWSYEAAERDPWKRAELRAEIDAIVADLYGLSVPEYAYILTTFPLLDRDQSPLPGDGFVTEGNDASRGTPEQRGITWDETEDGIVEIAPRSFVTRDLALLRYMQRKGFPIPADLDAFYREDVGLDPRGPLSRFRIGTIRDLEARVIEAKKLGAVAYIPSGRGGVQDEE